MGGQVVQEPRGDARRQYSTTSGWVERIHVRFCSFAGVDAGVSGERAGDSVGEGSSCPWFTPVSSTSPVVFSRSVPCFPFRVSDR